MARILRGDIHWADLDPTRGREQSGRRPVLVVSHDVFNERTGAVIAMAITSKPPRPGFPLRMPLRAAGLPKPSWLKIDQVRTFDARRVGTRVGRATPEDLAQAIEGLNEIIA